MFEIISTAVLLVLLFFINSFWIKIFLIFVCVVIVSTGFYSIFTGAPYLPSKKSAFFSMKELVKFKCDDVVCDLGCGDGRLVRAINKVGVKKSYGYEFSFLTFLFGRLLGGDIRFGNFWYRDFSEVTVVVCFLLPNSMERFGKDIWPDLKLNTKVVSNLFPIKGLKYEKYLDGVYFYIKK